MSFQKWFFAYNFFSSGPRGLKFGMTLRSIKIAQHAKFQPFRSIRKRIRAFFWLKMHISRDISLKSSGLVANMFHQTLKSHLLNIACMAIYKSTHKVSEGDEAIAENCRFLPDYKHIFVIVFYSLYNFTIEINIKGPNHPILSFLFFF